MACLRFNPQLVDNCCQLVPNHQSRDRAYTAGVDKIANGATQLQTNSSTLTNGASQLAAGVGQLDSKSSELLLEVIN